jgi:fatty acid desaturase
MDERRYNAAMRRTNGLEMTAEMPRRWLDGEKVSRLYPLKISRIWTGAAYCWSIIAGSLAAWAYFRNPWVFTTAFVLIATRQHALINYLHEAAHHLVSRDRRRNDWWSDVVFGAPNIMSTASYRGNHLLHHSNLGNQRLDNEINHRFLIRGWRFWQTLLRGLTGWNAVRALFNQGRGLKNAKTDWQDRLRHFGLIAITNGVLFSYCRWLGTPIAYLVLWLIPLATLTSLLLTLRVIAEHQTLEYARRSSEDFTFDMDPVFTRTIPANAMERFLFGPVNFGYHNEHHLYPGVPYTALPDLHRLLRDSGYYDEYPERLGTSYCGVLARQIFPGGKADESRNREDRSAMSTL